MKIQGIKLLAFFAFFAFTASAFAQKLDIPRPSPLCKLEQKVGLTTFKMEYSRPGVKDRKVFGELVPYGKLWRTGANAATVFETSDDIRFAGKEAPAGKYSLFTIPGEKEWTIILNKDPEVYVGDYDESKDLLRVKVPAGKTDFVETMRFQFEDIKMETAKLELAWEKTLVSIPIQVEVDARVMEQIKIEIAKAGDDAQMLYYQAARYYLDTGKDLKQAKEWMEKAVDTEEPKYWIIHQHAKILAGLGEYDAAIKQAEKSKDLAAKAENQDYVKLNEDAIKDWKKKM